MTDIYGVETKVLNQAVKRNMERFPQEVRFQLTKSEDKELPANWEPLHLRSQTVTSSRHGGRRSLPYRH
ncbi:MAG: ORF6N domain-containing protein [Chlorobium sp.]